MEFIELDEQNLEQAIKIQNEIFPVENGSQDIRDSLYSRPEYYSVLRYWLPKIGDEIVGICGVYSYTEYPRDAWLGWFGVLEQYRRKGYATQIMNFCMQKAKEMGFDTFRLYTDEQDNINAVKLYQKLGMISEVYDNPEDNHFEISKTLIFSKNVTGDKTTLWDNKNLYLNVHDEKNMTK